MIPSEQRTYIQSCRIETLLPPSSPTALPVGAEAQADQEKRTFVAIATWDFGEMVQNLLPSSEHI
jgi:hypothetical protein